MRHATEPVEELDESELQELLDQLTERMHGDGEFRDVDLLSAMTVVGEMKNRDMSLPSDSVENEQLNAVVQ